MPLLADAFGGCSAQDVDQVPRPERLVALALRRMIVDSSFLRGHEPVRVSAG
ncbi:MAG: hypothetical protein R2692_03210 [Microbacterium sp.]